MYWFAPCQNMWFAIGEAEHVFHLPQKHVFVFLTQHLFSIDWSLLFHSFHRQVYIKHSTPGRAPWELQRSVWLCLSSQIAHNQAKRTGNLSKRQIRMAPETHLLPSLASCAESWLSSTENKLIPTTGLQRVSFSNKVTFLIRELPLLHSHMDVSHADPLATDAIVQRALFTRAVAMASADVHTWPKLLGGEFKGLRAFCYICLLLILQIKPILYLHCVAWAFLQVTPCIQDRMGNGSTPRDANVMLPTPIVYHPTLYRFYEI